MNQNPYAAPKQPPTAPRDDRPAGTNAAAPQSPAFRVEGEDLVLREGPQLPSLCLKCGAAHAPTLRHYPFDFRWSPAWTYWFLLLGFLPGVLIISAASRSMDVPVPLCRACRWRWRGGTFLQLLGVAALVMWAAIGVVLASKVNGHFGAIMLASLAVWGASMAAAFKAGERMKLWVRRIEGAEMYLRGVHADARARLAAPDGGYG